MASSLYAIEAWESFQRNALQSDSGGICSYSFLLPAAIYFDLRTSCCTRISIDHGKASVPACYSDLAAHFSDCIHISSGTEVLPPGFCYVGFLSPHRSKRACPPASPMEKGWPLRGSQWCWCPYEYMSFHLEKLSSGVFSIFYGRLNHVYPILWEFYPLCQPVTDI